MRGDESGEWPHIVRKILDGVEKSEDAKRTTDNWAYHGLPRLDKWTSDDSKLILIGDAAHAIPPTAGQGANQAVEDALTLGKLLVDLNAGSIDRNTINAWEAERMDRVDRVLKLTLKLGEARLPEWDKGVHGRGPEGVLKPELDWVYGKSYE